jgi:hypothetical protein
MTAKERLDELLAALDRASAEVKKSQPGLRSRSSSSSRYDEISQYKEPKFKSRDTRRRFTSAVRTIGGEFSPQIFLKVTQFESDWDRERCQAPQRTYPCRIGTVSKFYNPIKSDWKPVTRQSRELSKTSYLLDR